MKKTIVMALSGGMDSATLLASLLMEGNTMHCCIFHYGSKHNVYEIESATKLIDYYLAAGYPVTSHYFDISEVMKNFNSALMKSNSADIPEGNYNDDTMKLTAVPGRNLIFASIMAGLAESIGADAIALGVHAGDHHIYPDCRPEFIKALDSVIYLSSDRKVEVMCPMQNIDKTGILQQGLSINVPYHLTRTCYKNQPLSCGKCGSCVERLEAFSTLGIDDPIHYENDHDLEGGPYEDEE